MKSQNFLGKKPQSNVNTAQLYSKTESNNDNGKYYLDDPIKDSPPPVNAITPAKDRKKIYTADRRIDYSQEVYSSLRHMIEARKAEALKSALLSFKQYLLGRKYELFASKGCLFSYVNKNGLYAIVNCPYNIKLILAKLNGVKLEGIQPIAQLKKIRDDVLLLGRNAYNTRSNLSILSVFTPRFHSTDRIYGAFEKISRDYIDVSKNIKDEDCVLTL